MGLMGGRKYDSTLYGEDSVCYTGRMEQTGGPVANILPKWQPQYPASLCYPAMML